VVAIAFVVLGQSPLYAQISFRSAIEAALQHSPRVKMAQDDVNRAAAAVSETRDVYIPSLGLGGGLGRSYGITLTVPTIFTVNAQSLVYSPAQRSYIRSAKQNLIAAKLTFEDVREQVEEDAAVTYISLEQAHERKTVLVEEARMASQLVDVTQQRAGVGLDSDLEVKRAKRVSLQLRLQLPHTESDMSALLEHLSALTGIEKELLETEAETIPKPAQFQSILQTAPSTTDTPITLSSEANAKAKAQQAGGDRRFAFRPQIEMQAQYGRISPINNVSDYYNLNGRYNTMQFGVAIQFPLFDKVHAAKARETASDAMHAKHEAEFVRDQQNEARLRLRSSLAELSTRLELTELDRDIARDQLKAMLLEVQTRSADVTGGRQMNPKDEVFARLDERQKYIDWLDADLDLHRTEITVMRQDGKLDDWLKQLTSGTTAPQASH
jgi:outer membrane protein